MSFACFYASMPSLMPCEYVSCEYVICRSHASMSFYDPCEYVMNKIPCEYHFKFVAMRVCVLTITCEYVICLSHASMSFMIHASMSCLTPCEYDKFLCEYVKYFFHASMDSNVYMRVWVKIYSMRVCHIKLHASMLI